MRILLIEDERNLARFIELELQHEGYEVGLAYDGQTGLHMAMGEDWDVVLLDRMLPGLDGLSLCRKLRAVRSMPILMLTAKGQVADRVQGLDAGADDYIPKPFAIEELLARIRAVLRRGDRSSDPASACLHVRDLQLDPLSYEVRRGEEKLDLTKREYELLLAFMENVNRVMSRQQLLDTVWGFETAVDTNVVDVYVRYLRNKIDRPDEPSLIQTLRGIGYVMKK